MTDVTGPHEDARNSPAEKCSESSAAREAFFQKLHEQLRYVGPYAILRGG